MAIADHSSESGAEREAVDSVDPLDPTIFTDAELTISGRLAEASNATFLGEIVTADGRVAHCVYKPVRGERPLWDFPDGTLAARELAAYRISAAAGFDLVPATVLIDGPLGPGSVQTWIEVDEHAESMVDLIRRGRVPAGWFDVVDGLDLRERPVSIVHRDDPGLRRMALFDALINNSDRKGMHILVDTCRRVWGIDHGVSLHVQDKLRTVLWGWAGEELTATERQLVTHALGASDELGDLVTVAEQEAFEHRCTRLLTDGILPMPPGHWPSIPWPPL